MNIDGLRGGADVQVQPVIDTDHFMVRLSIGGVHTVVMLSDLVTAVGETVLLAQASRGGYRRPGQQ